MQIVLELAHFAYHAFYACRTYQPQGGQPQGGRPQGGSCVILAFCMDCY